jgi:hypothetical protein
MLKKTVAKVGVLAGLLWMPQVYAASCEGMHIAGDLLAASGVAASGVPATQIVISSTTSIDSNVRSKFNSGDAVDISKGTIKDAVVEKATTCGVASNSKGAVSQLTITGATLTVATVEGASIKPKSGGDVVANVTVSGTLTNATVNIATIVPSPDQTNDPLGYAKDFEIVTLTAINAKMLEKNPPANPSANLTVEAEKNITIPRNTALHYASSTPDSYTLYTTGRPYDCWNPLGRLGCGDPNGLAEKTFVVSADEIKNKVLRRTWTQGVLVIPYKYVLSSSNLTTSSFTVGPYAGYTTDWWGMTLTFPFAAGLTSVTVPTVVNNVAGKTEKTGFSVASGLLFRPGGNAGSATLGIVIGVDYLSANSDYADNGRPWLGFYLGTGL